MMRFILTFFLLVGVFGVYAQNRHHGNRPSWEEVQKFKVKFLAQEMELTSEQTAKFTELYNKMSEEKRKVFETVRGLERKVRNNKNATDADYNEVSDGITRAKLQDAEIEKKYDEKFATFISKKQIFKLKQGEEKFRDNMREMRNRRHQKR